MLAGVNSKVAANHPCTRVAESSVLKTEDLSRRSSDRNSFAFRDSPMRLIAIALLLTTTCIGFAQDPKSDEIPMRYSKFQGDWVVASMQTETDRSEKRPEILVTVKGDRFTLSGTGVAKDLPQPLEFRIPKDNKENPYRELQRRGGKKIGDIVDVDNQIMVFWFVGIYKWADEDLHLALKYCGQGIEGQHFRDFRPPSSFADDPTDGEVRLVLKRKN